MSWLQRERLLRDVTELSNAALATPQMVRGGDDAMVAFYDHGGVVRGSAAAFGVAAGSGNCAQRQQDSILSFSLWL